MIASADFVKTKKNYRRELGFLAFGLLLTLTLTMASCSSGSMDSSSSSSSSGSSTTTGGSTGTGTGGSGSGTTAGGGPIVAPTTCSASPTIAPIDTNSAVTPDALKTMNDVRAKLGLGCSEFFSASWEAGKIPSGTKSNLEKLMSADDFNKLFPEIAAGAGDNATQSDYYTYANLDTASRYFPRFLGEGTTQDKYRELSAFLANSSHETTGGWQGAPSPAGAPDNPGRFGWGYCFIEESGYRGPSESSSGDTASYKDSSNAAYPPTPGKSYHGRGPVQLSWNYNYGMMSDVLWGDKTILLDNPTLVANDGVIGYASAIWFWMQPQMPKPSAHDDMVGNVDYDGDSGEPFTGDPSPAHVRHNTSQSKGHYADGSPISYSGVSAPNNGEVGFGLTINIINGGIEAGPLGNQEREERVGFFGRYLEYFGENKLGLSDPLSPEVGGVGGDPVRSAAVENMKNWRQWQDENPKKTGEMDSILDSSAQGSFY